MNDTEQAELKRTLAIVGTLGGKARGARRDIVEKMVDVDHIRHSFSRFLESLNELIDVEVPVVGDFELQEVQFRAEISADGDFKLLGAGVGIEASSGVTFTLRRRSQVADVGKQA